MKTRQGFVSNSSSSSFVLFARELSKDDVFYGRYEGTPYLRGKELYDGRDVFPLSDEMRHHVLSCTYCGTYLDVVAMAEYYDTLPRDLPDDVIVLGVEIDYHKTSTLDRFLEEYCGG